MEILMPAFIAAVVVFILIRRGTIRGVTGTSLAGAVAHNVGQMLVAAAVLVI